MLNELLMNSHARVQSRTVLGISRSSDKENQEPNEDCSQNDAHLEVGTSINKSHQPINSDLNEVSHNKYHLVGSNFLKVVFGLRLTI